MQHFEEALAAEQTAQDKYYEELSAAADGSADPTGKEAETPEWYEILRNPSYHKVPPPSSSGTATSSTLLTISDSISVRSAPAFATRTSPLIHHKRARSSVAYPSQSSLLSTPPRPPRPRSLYVPFQGCVDQPPGRAAKDILNALSYAPTHESYSSSSQEEFKSSSSLSSSRSSGASWGASSAGGGGGGSLSPKMSCQVLPCIPQSPTSPHKRMRSKSSSSLATMLVVGGGGGGTTMGNNTSAISPGRGRRRYLHPLHHFGHQRRRLYSDNLNALLPPICYSTQELLTIDGASSSDETVDEPAVSPSSSSAVRSSSPVYSPTNPLNNSENLALQLTHPPVIHPPPPDHMLLVSSPRIAKKNDNFN